MAASLVLVVAACTADRDPDAEPSRPANSVVAASLPESATSSISVSTSTAPSAALTDEACEVERRVTRLGRNDALGDGPIRVSGGLRNDPATFGIFRDAEAPDRQLIKLYWLRDVAFASPVRIAGARLSDGAPVVFLSPDRAASKVLQASDFVPGPELEIGADVLIVPGPGCYGIDLSTDGVLRTVVIRAA